MIKITVPATSANLGIGYDTLGMAVSLYSHFTFERADKLTITGCPEEFQNENNLVYVSFVDALAAWGEPAFPVAIDIQTDVPVARGLGSSSTCVVAGIMAAAAASSGFSICFMVPTFMVMLSSLTAVTSPYTSAVSASLTLLSEFSVAPVTLCDSCMVLLSDVFVPEHPTSVVIPRVMPSKIAIYFFFI